MLMNAALGKLRTFGMLLILAVGLLLAGATLAGADVGAPPGIDAQAHHMAGGRVGPVEESCPVASPQADCSTCCHDLGSSLCCGHIVALGTEATPRQAAIHHVLTGAWLPVAMLGALAEVGKRPPRYAA